MSRLHHFLDAQDEVYPQVLVELKQGKKETHWMWFIFPQLKGLGTSSMSLQYAIQDEAHAQAYWHHPVLGMRLRECFTIVKSHPKIPIEIFGTLDAMKYLSCRDLFNPL